MGIACFFFLEELEWPSGALLLISAFLSVDALLAVRYIPGHLAPFWLLETLETTQGPLADQNHLGWPVLS